MWAFCPNSSGRKAAFADNSLINPDLINGGLQAHKRNWP